MSTTVDDTPVGRNLGGAKAFSRVPDAPDVNAYERVLYGEPPDEPEAAKRLRGEQLTFEVGLPGTDQRGLAKPDFGSVKVSGDLALTHDLKRRQQVVVVVTTPDGDVITQALGMVTTIGFKDKTDKYGTTTERVHTVSLA